MLDAPEQQPEPKRPNRVERRQTAARDALRALLRDAYTARFGANSTPEGPIQLSLELEIDPSDGWKVEFTPSLMQQISPAMSAAQAASKRFQPGHVYCFRCDAPACEHSRPPSSLHVFRGYDAQGAPQWCEFAQVLIDAREERVDQLYERSPAVIAHFQSGRSLRSAQLRSFGRATRNYAILCQITSGFLPPGRIHGVAPIDRLAVTIQAAQVLDARGRNGLMLNVIAGGLNYDQWRELTLSGWEPWVERSISMADRRLDELDMQRELAGKDARVGDFLRRVPNVMRQLARALEQGGRQRRRRTVHAQKRHREKRPVHMALRDARRATPEALFADDRRSTWVVCGRNNRVHVFNRDGRLVTSLVLPPEAQSLRLRTRRWRPLRQNEIEQLQKTFEE